MIKLLIIVLLLLIIGGLVFLLISNQCTIEIIELPAKTLQSKIIP